MKVLHLGEAEKHRLRNLDNTSVYMLKFDKENRKVEQVLE